MVDAIGYRSRAAVIKVDRLSKEEKKKPKQESAPGPPDSEEEKKSLGAHIDERC